LPEGTPLIAAKLSLPPTAVALSVVDGRSVFPAPSRSQPCQIMMVLTDLPRLLHCRE